MSLAGAALGDVAGGSIETSRAIFNGVTGAVNAALDGTFQLSQWLEEKLPLGTVGGETPFSPQLPTFDDPETVTGRFIQSTAQFLTGFIPIARGAKAAGVATGGTAGGVAGAAAAGGAATAVVFPGDSGRVSDLLREWDHPLGRNAVTNYLATDVTDNEAEKRFKNAIEGMGLGVMADGVFFAARALRQANGARLAEKDMRARSQAEAALETQGTPDVLTTEEFSAVIGDTSEDVIGERIKVAGARALDTAKEARKAITEGTPPKERIYLNINRIDEPEDIQKALQNAMDLGADDINAARGGERQTFDAMEALADDLGFDAKELLSRRRDEPMSAPQAIAYRRVLNGSAENLHALAQNAKNSPTPAKQYAFRKALAVHFAIQTEVTAARTATARALASWRISVKGDKERAQAIELMLDQSHDHGRHGTSQLIDAVLSQESTAGINALARQSGRRSTGEAIYEAWINGLLASPKTHAVNVLSNSINSAYAIPERWMQSIASKTMFDGGITGGEVNELAFASIQGFREGARLAAKALKEGEPQFSQSAKVETRPNAISGEALGLRGVPAMAADWAGEVIRTPTRLLGAEDDFFKAIGYRQQLNAMAFRQAVSEGLSGDDLANRVRALAADPPESLRMQAADFAEVQTFTNELGRIGKQFQQLRSGVPGVRWVAPFMRTPTNIMVYAFRRTPLAPFVGQTRALIRAGELPNATPQQRASGAEAMGRVALGSMVMATFADMTRSGLVTGAGPADFSLRQARERQGMKAYSVKIGDRYFAYNRLDPLGLMIGVAADTAEIIGSAGDEEGDEVALAGAIAFANNMANKTYMSGIFNTIKAIDDPSRNMMSLARSYATSAIPFSSLVRNIEGAVDPVVRETRSPQTLDDPMGEFVGQLVATMRSKTPGLSSDMPPKRNLWGEPIDRSSGLGAVYDFISPVYSSLHEPDAVDNAILDNRVHLEMPPRQIENVMLSAEEYSRYTELAGKNAKELLDNLVGTPAFEALSDGPDGFKADQIKKAVRTGREQAKAQMQIEFSELRLRIQDKLIENAQSKAGEVLIQ